MKGGSRSKEERLSVPAMVVVVEVLSEMPCMQDNTVTRGNDKGMTEREGQIWKNRSSWVM